MRKENNMGTDKAFPLLMRLVIPSMLAQFVNVLYGIVDRIFISNMQENGALALAGVGVCAPIVIVITSFCYLVALGGAPLAAIKLGEGNKAKAQKIMSNCCIFLLAISLIITAVFFAVKNPMLRLFGASENTFLYANQYLTVYLTGTVFAIMSLGLNSFITCQGYSKVAMASVLIGAIVNIILDPIFIFTLNWGVKGGAFATVIAQGCSFLWVALFLLGKRTVLKLSFKNFDIKIIGKVVTLGLSPFLIMATEGVIIIALNAVLAKYAGAQTDNYIAGATIVVSFMQLIVLPLGGITMGAQPLISYNFGAKFYDRINLAVKYLVIICFVFLAIMFIVSRAMPHAFIRIFTENKEITDIAVRGIKYYTLGIFFLTAQFPFVDTLTALGCAKHAVFLSMLRKVGVLLPLTFLLPAYFGVDSAFLAEAIADSIGGIASAIIFMFSIKKIYARRDKAPVCVE